MLKILLLILCISIDWVGCAKHIYNYSADYHETCTIGVIEK